MTRHGELLDTERHDRLCVSSSRNRPRILIKQYVCHGISSYSVIEAISLTAYLSLPIALILPVSYSCGALSNMPGQQLEPLAVVGISVRFPGEAVSPESFWQLILSGRSTGKEIPPDRYGIDAWHHPDYSQLDRVSQRKANFLEGDIGQFDAGFFSISAAEAEAMDPQQRLALETAYHALENAGYPIESITGSKMAVFTGAFSNDYQRLHAKDLMTLPKGHATGTSMNMLANRVSWFFNLRGPSSNVDTACSSSLMALHLACQSIWNGESSSV